MTPQRVVADYVSRADFSGVVLIRRHGRPVYQRAVGLADRARGTPITMGTRFEIASISKVFVAIAVRQLVDAGLLTTDAPVGRILPELLADPSARAWASRITVQQLLTHTAGLPREHDFQPAESLSTAAQVARIGRLSWDSAAVGRYHYSNAGYVLLGAIVERVSGHDYDELVRARILGPLGLPNAGFFVGSTMPTGVAASYRRGRNGWMRTPPSRHRGVYAPGGMYASATDLATLAERLDTASILSPASRALMASPDPAAGADGAAYALAWQLRDRSGRRYRLASGSADGAKSVVMHEPTQQLTIVVLTNAGDVPVLDMLRDLTLSVEGEGVAPPTPCRSPASTRWLRDVGVYDFTGTALAREMSDPTLHLELVAIDRHPYLFDANDPSGDRLCWHPSGWMRPAFTRELQLLVRSTDRGATMSVRLSGATSTGRRLAP